MLNELHACITLPVWRKPSSMIHSPKFENMHFAMDSYLRTNSKGIGNDTMILYKVKFVLNNKVDWVIYPLYYLLKYIKTFSCDGIIWTFGFSCRKTQKRVVFSRLNSLNVNNLPGRKNWWTRLASSIVLLCNEKSKYKRSLGTINSGASGVKF